MKINWQYSSQCSIQDWTKLIEKPQDWTKDGLLEKILRFIIETDQVTNAYI